jgi:histidinol-phosphate phosphatase family protein
VAALKYTVLLIAGGKGTRSIDPSVPKSLHEIAAVPLIQHQISFLQTIGCKKVVVIGNFGFGQISDFVDDLNLTGIEVNLIAEDKFGGTLGAIQHCSSQITDSHVWVILGDLFFQNHLEVIERNNDLESIDLMVITHPNDHPFDSDLVTFNQIDNNINSFYSKTDKARVGKFGNSAVAGIYFINLNKLSAAPTRGDISGDLIPFALLAKWKVLNFTSIEYCKDSGTPNRIKAIEEDLLSGVIARRSGLEKSVCFIDLDDTLASNTLIKNADFLARIIPETITQIGRLNSKGIPIIIVSNQPGIAKGFFDLKDWSNFRSGIEVLLANSGAFIDDWIICPHHPEIGHQGEISAYKIICQCRKPKSGLFLEMKLRHSIDLTKSYMIGDSDLDRDSAIDVGIKFIHATCVTNTGDKLNTWKALERVVNSYDKN